MNLAKLSVASAPVAAIVLGSAVGYQVTPSKEVVSGLRFVAIGIVIAALSAEFVPNMLEAPELRDKIASVAGFVGGAMLMILMRTLLPKDEGKASPYELAGALAADFFVDAVMVGMSLGLAEKLGSGTLIVGAALSTEMLILSMTTGALMKRRGEDAATNYTVTGILVAAVVAGLTVGYVASTNLRGSAIIKGLVATGAASVIWLLTEELLGHSPTKPVLDSRVGAALIFLGFGVMAFSEWFDDG